MPGSEVLETSSDSPFFGYLEIAKDGRITFLSTRAECGQGISAGFAVLIAEELDVDPASINILSAGVNNRLKVLSDADNGGTGGSSSIRSFYAIVRKSAATARDMLLMAAAREWQVPLESLIVKDGQVVHGESHRSASFANLAAAASVMKAPADPVLKSAQQFKYIGKGNRQPGLLPRVTGAAQYGIDVNLPGMLSASIIHCPFVGGTLASIDENAARAHPGVRTVVKMPFGVAVVADTFWNAQNAAKKLILQWTQTSSPSSEAIFSEQKRLVELPGMKAKEAGKFDNNYTLAKRKVEASYHVPYLPHTTLEPQNCTAWVKSDGTCEVWAPTQDPVTAADLAAQILGISGSMVKINTMLLGGGFGRRLRQDYVSEAVHIAKAVPNVPIKVLWQRNEEFTHDLFRPSSDCKMQAGIDDSGKLVAWRHRIACSSIYSWLSEEPVNLIKPATQPRIDKTATEGADDADQMYSIPNFTCEWHQYEPGVPVFWWRSVGHSQNAFFVESFMDECAAAAGIDPLTFRLNHVLKPRWRTVLELIREKSGWSTPAAPNMGRGLAIHASFGSIVAQVVEVSVETQTIYVHKVTVVIDCGTAVDSNLVHTQMESSIAQALAAALRQEITVTNGRIDQTTLIDCRPLTMSEMPRVETHIIPSTGAPGGIGEPGVPPLAPAVANAVFALTGQRLRSMPFKLA
jgi:CO/xanthine dehydrogenase Mo-binding subunit